MNSIDKMIHIDKAEFQSLSKIPRLNLINSCMGYKSANLIGSISEEGQTSIAVLDHF